LYAAILSLIVLGVGALPATSDPGTRRLAVHDRPGGTHRAGHHAESQASVGGSGSRTPARTTTDSLNNTIGKVTWHQGVAFLITTRVSSFELPLTSEEGAEWLTTMFP